LKGRVVRYRHLRCKFENPAHGAVALRGYYITMRLRHGKVNIDKLAMACGTSAKIILQTYYDFSSEKEYDELTKGFELQEDSPSVELDDEGFLINNELDEAMM
jgi:hypothetical protein